MSKKYTIYHGGHSIAPADDRVIQIYHGADLIWERQTQKGDYVYAIFENADLEDHVFTSAGLIIPESLLEGYTNNAYTLAGAQTAVSFPDDDYWRYIWADVPMYHGDESHDLLIYSADMSTYTRVSLSPALDMDRKSADLQEVFAKDTTDTIDALSAASAFVSNRSAYWHGVSQSYGGIVPLSLLYGVLSGAAEPTWLSYTTTDGTLITGADYIILGSCKDGLICAENLRQPASLKIFATISLRQADGTKIKDLITEEIEIFNPQVKYNAVAEKRRNPRTNHSFHISRGKSDSDIWITYLAESSGGFDMINCLPGGTPYALAESGLAQPMEFDCARDRRWFFGGKDDNTYICRQGDLKESQDGYFGLHKVDLTATDTGTTYSIQHEYIRDGGAHYTDASGENYIIAQNVNTETFALLRVGHND